ncbi:APC family permease [Sporomusa sp.]|uniref:APC family permease n=1 Tax=Sporomusa sp. TaxID=2078658 RepID=UPI002BA42667|nr:APC family permease [Sporomusa sp.]HWR42771.1 APC family permease [Sporomusa sp.]
MFNFQRLIIGRPLKTEEAAHEKLPKWKALSIFSSDALSSVGYGPEQIIVTLAVPGMLIYGYFGYATIAVIALLAIVTLSYVQVARANPGGGGSYSIALQNLGETPALVAAASLIADYVLTVAVSVSSGTDALVSAFPALIGREMSINLLVLFGILTVFNLRGVRESSNVFVWPTYFFILGIVCLIGTGVYKAFTGIAPIVPAESLVRQQADWVVVVLALRAFANGCSSMTGIEAISNGVPMFKEPGVKNAIRTTYFMALILGLMIAGISFLFMHYHLLPEENVTMLSQLAEQVFGRGWAYYYIQITTMLILYLAANTAYNGLPPLLSIMARDSYVPRYLGEKGERLGYSKGILLLSLVSAALIFVFNGNVEHLISLYAIGVFLSFTIAQSSLVVKWRRERDTGWISRVALNSFGACVTGIVVLVIAITKFTHGAWIVLVFIPAMIYILKTIHSHYLTTANQLRVSPEDFVDHLEIHNPKNLVIVPISGITKVVAASIRYSKTLGGDVIALYVYTDEEERRKFEEKWNSLNLDIPLRVLYSPYRSIVQPVLGYVSELEMHKSLYHYITIVIPEFEPAKWWHRLLHNQTGWILRTLLILRENVIVSTLPYHFKK